MSLRSLTRREVIDLAESSQIFFHGEEYCDSGQVYKFSFSGNRITSKVHGSYGDYSVKISENARDPDELECSCDCPYDGDICKHVIATLLYHLKKRTKTSESMGAEIPPPVKQTLESMTHDDLIGLIFELADEEDEFRRALIAKIKISPQIIKEQPKNPKLVKKLKGRISSFFEDMAEQSRYEDYRDRKYGDGRESPEIDSVYETAKTLNPKDQAEIYWYVVEYANNCSEDYVIAEAQVESALAFYADAAAMRHLEHKRKHPDLDGLLEAADWSICETPKLSAALKNAFDKICAEEEDYRYVINGLKKSRHREVDEWLASFYLKLGDDKNYLKIRRKNLSGESQYLDLALYWKSKGDAEKYIDTMEEWAAKLSDEKRESFWDSRFSKPKGEGVLSMLAEHYRSMADDENLCRILMTTARYGNFNPELYRHVEAVAKKLEKWDECRSTLIEYAETRPELLAEIYIYEKDWNAAIKLAEEITDYESMKVKVAEEIKDSRPEEAIKIYEKLVEAQIDHKSRANYRIAAEHAKGIKSICKTVLKNEGVWRDYIEGIRKKYKRLLALQDELGNL